MSLSDNIGLVIQAIGNAVKGKQAILVSGSNIKTINGSSILGGGDLVVSVGGGSSSVIYTQVSNQTFTVVTPEGVTNLVAPLLANSTYLVECFVTFQSAATTTGAGIGFTSPTGSSNQLEVRVPITTTAVATQLRKIFPSATETITGEVLGTGVTAINSPHTARINGIITTGATAGNFQVRCRTEVANSTITVLAGSRLVITKIA